MPRKHIRTGRTPPGRPPGTPQSPEARARISTGKLGVPHPAGSHARHAAAARLRWSDPAYRKAHKEGWAAHDAR